MIVRNNTETAEQRRIRCLWYITGEWANVTTVNFPRRFYSIEPAGTLIEVARWARPNVTF